ncbi:MAG: S41 family peptidase [Bacteroidia bacterium]|nr:S41 family peptidase [Bacteroidia bacterium]
MPIPRILFGSLFLSFLLCLPCQVFAQSEDISPVRKAELDSLVHRISALAEEFYISQDTGQLMGELLQEKLVAGAYADLSHPDSLARRLTRDLRSVNGDLHMYVEAIPPGDRQSNDSSHILVDRRGAWSNYGFQKTEILDGNIGYIKVSHFTSWRHFEAAQVIIQQAIKNIEQTDALIVDLRANGGGFEEIVAYMISYFFDGEVIHLSDYYCRHDDNRSSIYTQADVPGKKLPDLPLYILIDKKTGSAAESFAYMLKHLDRAMVIGERSAGAGNGASQHRAADRFLLTVACQQSINAVTQTSFEKQGVIPHIETSSSEARNTAYKLALEQLRDKEGNEIHPVNYDRIIDGLEPK